MRLRAFLPRAYQIGVLASFAIALCLVSLPALAQPGQPDRSPVVVGWTEAPGFSSAARDGVPTGFFADLARLVSDDAGFAIEFRRFDTVAEVIKAQATGESQMIAGLARLPVIESTNHFSDPVATSRVRLYVRAEERVEFDLSRFRGRRVGTIPPTAGSDTPLIADQNEIIAYEGYAHAHMALLTGLVDGIVSVDAPNGYMLRHARLDHRVVPAGPDLGTVPRFVALHDSRADLLAAINASIETLESDGRLDDLRRRWSIEQAPPVPDVLSVGVMPFPPYVVIAEDGTASGYSIEVLKSLADLAGYQLRFERISSAEWKSGPQAGSFDLLPQASMNEDRRTRMDFTTPIDASPLSIFVRPDNADGITDLDDLAGMRVGVSVLNVSNEIARRHGGFDVVPYATINDLIQGFLSGEVDALLHLRAAVLEKAEIDGFDHLIAAVERPFATADRAIALRQGLGEVRERFNALLPGFLVSEQYQQIRQRWLSEKPFWTPVRIRVITVCVSAVGGALAIFASVEWRRRRIGEAEALRQKAAYEQELLHRQEMNLVLAQLETKNLELERSNADLERFAYVASHDLKSPLRTIANAARWLEEDLGDHFDNDTRESMDMITSRVNRMDRFLDDLLRHAQIGRTNEPTDVVPLSELVADVGLFASSPENFDFLVELPDEEILIQRMPLQQVLINLVANAIKHHDLDRGVVTLRVTMEGSDLKFCVIDDGPGIATQFHDKIWHMFSTLRTRDQLEGSGMGLAIVRKILDTHGGSITLISGNGRGSTFILTWPLVSEAYQTFSRVA
jgi:signal transduction histidine kinase